MHEAFTQLKKNLELDPSFNQTIQQKHNAVRSAIQNIDPTITSKLIGSVGRNTKIQPRQTDEFDIDVLVILGKFYNWALPGSGISPEDAKAKMREIAGSSDRYQAMNPQVDEPTIFFEYKDGVKVELVPAYIDMIGHSYDGTQYGAVGRGYWIVKNGQWELADYTYEANYISQQNQSYGGWVIPVVKMLKALRRQHFQDLGSFPLETIAIQLIPALILNYKQREIPLSYHGLVSDFFGYGSEYLNRPLKVPGSNSPSIVLDPNIKANLTNQFSTLSDYTMEILDMTNRGDQIRAWKALFGDPFPSR